MRGGGAFASKKLLAAFAVLAVAFVVLAAVPAVVTDSDADTATPITKGVELVNALKSDKDGSYIVSNDISASISEIITVQKIISIDLNGKTITLSGGKTITATGTLSFKNGTVTYTGFQPVNAVFSASDDGILEFDKVTLTVDGAALYPYGDASKVIVKNKSVITAKSYAIGTNNKESKENTLNIEVIDSTLVVSDDDKDDATVLVNVPGVTLSIKNSILTGDRQTLIVRCGTATVEDTTINHKGGFTGTISPSYTSKLGDPWGSGNEVVSAAVVVGDNADTVYDGAATLTLKGGSIETSDIGIYVISDKNTTATLNLNSEYIVKATLAGNIQGSGKIVGEISTLGVATYALSSVNGKITVNADSSLIIPAGKTLTFAEGASIVGTSGDSSILYLYGTADNTKIERTNLKVMDSKSQATVDSVAVADDLLKAGAEDVKIESSNLTIDQDFIIPAGSKLTLNNDASVVVKAGKTFTVNGALVNVNNIILNKDVSGASQVVLNDLKKSDMVINGPESTIITFADVTGNVIVKAGSLNVDVSGIDSGKITVSTDNVHFFGNLNKNLEIEVTSNKMVSLDDLNINSGAKLTLIATSGEFKVGGKVSVYGSIYGVGGAVLNVNKADNGSFTAYSGSSISNVDITGDGKIDLSLAQKDFEIGQDISSNKDFGQLENVVVIGTLTIGNNATVTVKGGFQINEGVTLTIESGATLKIDSSAAAMVINGTIIVEDGGNLIVKDSDSVTVSGSIESEGRVEINSKVTIKSGGTILINEGETEDTSSAIYHSTIMVVGGLTVEAGAVLEIRSEMDISPTGITNKGTVVLAGAVLKNDSTIALAASDASVIVTSVSGEKELTITDSGLKFADKTDVSVANAVVLTPGSNAVVSGLTVAEKVTSYINDAGATVYENNMILSGSVIVSVADSEGSTSISALIVASGKRLAVEDALALGNNMTLTVPVDSELIVSGTVTGALAVTGASSAAAAKVTNHGTVTVTGLIQVQDKIAESGVINAAMYTTTSGTTKVANYSTLKDAVASGTKTIEVTGTITVSEDLTVPAGVTIKSTGTVNVGSTKKTDDDRNVVLTFADGATTNGGKYEVIGTLVFENKKNDKAEKISDVAVIGDKSSKYTNLYTAIKGAQAGDVVSIYADRVVLDASLTIPADVTLDVPSGKTLILDKGVTLTVAGTLKTAQALAAETGVGFAAKASTKTGDLKAAIVVTGKFMSQASFDYNSYKISGAYFHLIDTVGDYFYVAPVEYAASVAADVQNATVEIFGTVTAGDVAFAGTSTVTVTVTVRDETSTVTVASLTLANAVLDFNGKSFTGTVKVGDASVAATKVAALKVNFKDGSEDRMLVESVKFDNTADKFETAAFAIASGTVSVKAVDSASKGPMTVSQGAVMMSSVTNLDIGDEVIIFVDGVITVDNGQTISVGKTEIMGTISVAKETDTKDKGTFSAQTMYVGITAEEATGTAITGAAAVLSGNVTLADDGSYAVVLNGSDVDSDAVKALGTTVTVYSVEGKDWITVYAKGDVAINTIKTAFVENALFNNWVNEKGGLIDKNDTTTYVGSENCAKVTADIKYDIYTVSIIGCEGVESIAIDGNLVSDVVELKAGQHTVTYTVANMYGGEGKLSLVTVDAYTTASVSGMTFSVSGSEGKISLQITGISATGYNPVTPVTPSEKDDGLTITDYLLIVLVVLIVIMAVIVAMRLMRS